VSTDDLESHREFAAKLGLNFPLIADEDGVIAARYGVGSKLGFANRTTFLIGRDGTILRTFPSVTVEGHDDEVLAALRAHAR
jgi:thioredoxin-dependent peroxiredoxin